MTTSTSPRSRWLDDAVLPLLGALTWAAWTGFLLAGAANFLTSQQVNPLAEPAVFLLLLGGSAAARLARGRTRAGWYSVLAGLLAVLLAEWWLLYWPAYALWNPAWLLRLAEQVGQLAGGPLFVLIAAALIWRHGAVADWTSHTEATWAFMGGVVVLGAAFIIAALAAPGELGLISGAALRFIIVAWAALSLTGVSDASRSAANEHPLRLNRYWVVAALGAVGAIFALGLLVTWLVTPQSVADWIALLGPLFDLLRQILLDVIFAVTFVIFLVVTPLIDWLRSLLGPGNPVPFNSNPFTPPTPNDQNVAAVTLPPVVALILHILVVVVVLTVLALIVAWTLRRTSTTDEAGVRENRELIWSWGLIQSQLSGLLARRQPAPLFDTLSGDAADTILWVRQLYRRVLEAAVARGIARPGRQTPDMFLATLMNIWPDEVARLVELTAAYDAARYGQLPPTPRQLEVLKTLSAHLIASQAQPPKGR